MKELKVEDYEKLKRPRFEVYKTKKGEWRWRYCTSKGIKLATGRQGFSTKSNAIRSVRRVRNLLNGPAKKRKVLHDFKGPWRLYNTNHCMAVGTKFFELWPEANKNFRMFFLSSTSKLTVLIQTKK